MYCLLNAYSIADQRAPISHGVLFGADGISIAWLMADEVSLSWPTSRAAS